MTVQNPPAVASRYSLPLASRIRVPFPSTTTQGAVACRASCCSM
ncbi:Uncharacterised protein [Bordetella pertussis]|nr:Uncharacterised protein [Bordetella pertussis]CFW45018.1 Uncharacterised protein [Bordetella pertussis]